MSRTKEEMIAYLVPNLEEKFRTRGKISTKDLKTLITCYRNLRRALNPFFAHQKYSLMLDDVFEHLHRYEGYMRARKEK